MLRDPNKSIRIRHWTQPNNWLIVIALTDAAAWIQSPIEPDKRAHFAVNLAILRRLSSIRWEAAFKAG